MIIETTVKSVFDNSNCLETTDGSFVIKKGILADACMKYLKEGSLVRLYGDEKGNITTVYFLGGR